MAERYLCCYRLANRIGGNGCKHRWFVKGVIFVQYNHHSSAALGGEGVAVGCHSPSKNTMPSLRSLLLLFGIIACTTGVGRAQYQEERDNTDLKKVLVGRGPKRCSMGCLHGSCPHNPPT